MQLTKLASRAEFLSKDYFANIAGGCFRAAQSQLDDLAVYINRVTQYDSVELAKREVTAADKALVFQRKNLISARQRLETVSEEREKHQQELTSLLHRKPRWVAADLEAFTNLTHAEHEINISHKNAQLKLEQAESMTEESLAKYLDSIRAHYNEELLWSEKGRRISNYLTSSLIVLNVVLFALSIFALEPRKREAIAVRVAQDNTRLFESATKKLEDTMSEKLLKLERRQVETKQILNTLMTEGEKDTLEKSSEDDFQPQLPDEGKLIDSSSSDPNSSSYQNLWFPALTAGAATFTLIALSSL